MVFKGFFVLTRDGDVLFTWSSDSSNTSMGGYKGKSYNLFESLEKRWLTLKLPAEWVAAQGKRQLGQHFVFQTIFLLLRS